MLKKKNPCRECLISEHCYSSEQQSEFQKKDLQGKSIFGNQLPWRVCFQTELTEGEPVTTLQEGNATTGLTVLKTPFWGEWSKEIKL